MKKALWMIGGAATLAVAAFQFGPRLIADNNIDWGMVVQREMIDRSEQLFGVGRPLTQSALGPYTGADPLGAIKLAGGLRASLVSSAAHPSTDQIAFWPNDNRPTHLFVCNEGNANPSVQKIDLSLPTNANATTILTGVASCDPLRRTPWGSLTAGEETGDGGLYEIMNPMAITSPVAILNRAAGTTSNPLVVKRKAAGQLAWEGNPLFPDGSMIFGDELGPSGGNPGGAIYKFIPDHPFETGGVITNPSESPLASGKLYGLKVGSAGDNGQGTEVGKGVWVPVTTAPDANGNIDLRAARLTLKLTGYYRPEDMDIDPIARSNDEVHVCWTNTGRMSNGPGSVEETAAIVGEVMCLTDEEDDAAVTGGIPLVERFVPGSRQFFYFDNVAFQPHTNNVAFTEDASAFTVVKEDGTTEVRGNDILLCLPDGDDNDVQTDGCIRIASIADVSSEPTGIIFTGSGEQMYVSIQHRSTGVGAILKISGFQIRRHPRDRDRWDDWWPWGWGKKGNGHSKHW